MQPAYLRHVVRTQPRLLGEGLVHRLGGACDHLGWGQQGEVGLALFTLQGREGLICKVCWNFFLNVTLFPERFSVALTGGKIILKNC